MDANWADTTEYDGFVTNSVVVFAVRKGNPKNIRRWEDLVEGGRRGDHAEPVHVGRRAVERDGGLRRRRPSRASRTQEATSSCSELLDNTPVQDKSARESLQTFDGGKGDVLLAYENEAIAAQSEGRWTSSTSIPDQTILIENPVAVVEEGEDAETAKAFVDWLASRGAEDLRREGLPVGAEEDLVDETKYPTPKTLFEIDEFGGWSDGERKVLRPREGRDGRDRAGAGGLHCRLTPSTAGRPAPPAPRGARRRGPLVVGGLGVAWLTLIVLIPLAAVVARSLEGGVGAFWDARHRAAGGRRAQAHAGRRR